MVKFCASCGTANPPASRFCAKCGASLGEEPVVQSTKAFEPEVAGLNPDPKIAPVATVSTSSIENGEPDAPGRNWIVVIAIIGTVLIIGALYFWLFVADDIGEASDQTGGAAVEAGEIVAPTQMFVMTEANVRDKSTTVGSTIIGKMPRGSAVTGAVKLGEDGVSEWLELADGAGFIATVNLGEAAPPDIAKALDDKIWSSDTAIDIWAQADTASALVDRVKEGTRLTLAGLTANDFIEIKLSRGGVGYIANGAAILSRLGGKPIAINFNPQTCTFGSDLNAEFARIGSRLRSQWQALEDKEFVDDEAREKAYAASEGKSSYVKLPRSFDGLTLTAIGQHYESQSIYFADPPAKVIEVFRAKGFKIDGNGTFPSTELYAGISATRGEGAAYGKSELGCGV